MRRRDSTASRARRLRPLVAVSQQSHCLNALLHRWHDGHLPIDIVGIVSNHDDQRSITEWYGIPFVHLPIEQGRKPEQEAQLLDVFERQGADLLVLARYMQILPPEICEQYVGQVINIHHSFLPSFVGAKPYHQAAERGVKLIGATCHYVTQELDAGPIIDQDVIRISHNDTVEDMVRLGKDVEKSVLARGVRSHLEDRVLLHGNKTIVF